MKSYLVGTQIFIWSLIAPNKLSPIVKQIVENNFIYVSQISLFEIAIKQKIGKLPELNIPIIELLQIIGNDNFIVLPLKNQHLISYNELPIFDEHKDPFDRLLLATSLSENIPIISADENFKKYTSLVQLIGN